MPFCVRAMRPATITGFSAASSIFAASITASLSPTGGALSADVAQALKGGPMVLFLGRISWEKGLDRLVAALPFAPSVRAVLAGESAAGYADSLEAQARQLGIADRLTIVARHVDGADQHRLGARGADIRTDQIPGHVALPLNGPGAVASDVGRLLARG